MIQAAERDNREVLLRPLRRAIGSITCGLYQMGVEVCSLRNVGYLVKQPLKKRESRMDDGLLHLALPGLLPESHILVINPKLRVVSLLCTEIGATGICVQVQFPCYGMAVLIPLL